MAARDGQIEVGLSLDELIGVARRRFWWFLVPSVIGMAIASVLALSLPAEYEAEATVAVEPQVIPENLANTTIAASTEARYDHLRMQVLARDNLSALIDEFNMYPDSPLSREDLVDDLRTRIIVEPLPPAIYDPRKAVELNSFRIAFQWHTPKLAADVANRLTRDFISANLRDRASLAEGTTEFFEQELGKARAELADVGRQITDYKENFQGELPEQLIMNRERLERARMDLSSAENKLETARDQSRLLALQIEEMHAASTTKSNDPSLRKKSLELRLNQLLATGRTEKHPDVRLARAEIASLDDMISNQIASPRPRSMEETRLRNDLRDYEVDTRVLAGEVERLKADIADFEQRIENTPRRQAELDHMEKSYANLHTAIRAIQLKQVDANMMRTIELANKGERFKIVESAVPSSAPFKPNRPLWFIAGSLMGVITGLALLVIRELSDQTFHSIQSLQNALGLPVLAAVPAIELAKDPFMTRRRVMILGASSAALLLALLLGGTIYFFVIRNGAPDVAPPEPSPEAVIQERVHV